MPERLPLPGNGVVVPLISPLRSDGSPDSSSLRSLVDHVLGAGVSGVLVLGSSGESGALAAEDRQTLAAEAVQAAGDRCHVMVGVAALGTNDAIADARRFTALGAHSLLVPLPFMFTPSRREARLHFELVASAAGIPLVAYDVPSRVRAALAPDLVAELARDGVIAAVKDSSNDLAKQRRLVEATAGLAGFVRCTGAEEAIDGLLLAGFDVPIPGLANVFPDLHVTLAEAAAAGDWEEASRLQARIVGLLSLYDAPLAAGSPTTAFFAAVKEALRQLGVIETATTSRPFAQGGPELGEHVAGILAWARKLTA